MNNNFPRFDLEGQVALVTGAARGIGNACALALAHAGADIALGLRDVKTGGELASQIEAMGRRAREVRRVHHTHPDRSARPAQRPEAPVGPGQERPVSKVPP